MKFQLEAVTDSIPKMSEPFSGSIANPNSNSSKPIASGNLGTALESLKSRPLSLNRGDKNQSPPKKKRRGKAQNR
jgi:hypothetical protein